MEGYFPDSDRYRASVEQDDRGLWTGVRYARVRAATRDEALAWEQLPRLGEPYDQTMPFLPARSYRVSADGGSWWLIRIGYAQQPSGTAGGEPAPTPGLLFTRFGNEEGSAVIYYDRDGNRIENGTSVVVRYPRVEVVHHRSGPVSPLLVLGLAVPGRDAAFAVTNDRETMLPPFEWDNPNAQGFTMPPGSLLYLRTTQEYARNGLFIARHFFRAAPDHRAWWFTNDGSGGRVEHSGVVYPSADLSVLWA